jgi:AcrR family transcriptional regulator
MTGRRGRPGHDLDSVLSVAVSVFNERGYDGTSMEELSKRQARVLDAPAIDRLELLIRGAVAVLESRLPYVTLLLRIRGNTDIERSAIERRKSFDALVASLVSEAERDGDVRADVDPKATARLLFGMINSIAEWYRPGRASGRRVRRGVRRAPYPQVVFLA